MRWILGRCGVRAGKILDPFAGSGTALFAASEIGLDAEGIELLPIGQRIVHTRAILERDFTSRDYDALNRWRTEMPWRTTTVHRPIGALRITAGAYPPETQVGLERYLGAASCETESVRAVLEFALLCVLESISFTRKDGQYLRWDARSGRRQGANPFNKGPIRTFDEAMHEKLTEIVADTRPVPMLLDVDPDDVQRGSVRLLEGVMNFGIG